MARQSQQRQKYSRQWIKETADGQQKKSQLIKLFIISTDDWQYLRPFQLLHTISTDYSQALQVR